MIWGSGDLKMVKNSMEYIDTALLPLFPFSLREDMGQATRMTEYINFLALQLERQFRGRILLLPGYSYFKNRCAESLIQEVNEWENELQKEGFKHIFFITSDSNWRMREENLSGTLLWLPSVPLDKINDSEKKAILDDQVKQLTNLFFRKWK